ncbi:hypothetical protein ScPMuIL_007553 [Solemya velum]
MTIEIGGGTDMEYDCIRKVKCFQHCDKNYNILCFQLPFICPLCRRNVSCSESRIPPYSIPSPFGDAMSSPYSVLIKPTYGSFIRDYENSSNLHIGITDSKGVAYDYDEEGIHVNSLSWNQCVVIPLSKALIAGVQDGWDNNLYQFSRNHRWSTDWYRDSSHNCFTFVLQFLHHMDINRLMPCVASRSEFCKEQIVPHTTRAAQFIGLYRQIEKEGFVIQVVKPS